MDFVLRAFPTKCLEGTKITLQSPFMMLWEEQHPHPGHFLITLLGPTYSEASLAFSQQDCTWIRRNHDTHKSLCAASSAGFLHFSALRRSLTLLGRTKKWV